MPASADGQRPARDPWNIGFGAVALAAALVSLLIWFPNDIKGGFIEINQIGKPEPGDAFFPIILASMLMVLGGGQLLGAMFSRKPQAPPGKLTADNLKFLFVFYGIIAVGLTVMYWLGPLVVDSLRAVGMIDHTYRQLVDTVPYKYLGYVVGGFIMTIGLIIRAEGLIRPRAVLSVVAVIASLIFILDILLHNIQLPPNADF
jgi:hypothetical protein